MGIINIKELADRMATKWIVRGLQNPQEIWVIVLFKKLDKFNLKGKRKWVKLLLITICASKYEIVPKGSPLSCSIWKCWIKLKKNLLPPNNIQKSLTHISIYH